MTDSDLRRRIEERYQRGQDSLDRARSFTEPDRRQERRVERPAQPERKVGADRELDFVMPRFLLVIVVATIATGALAVLVDGRMEPGRVLVGAVAAVPTVIVLMYVSYILTYIGFKAFWLLQAVSWLLALLVMIYTLVAAVVS